MRRIPAVLLWMGVSACGDASPGGSMLAVRDSAGVEIVELEQLAAPVEWTVGPEPLWAFDGAGQDGLSEIRDLAFVTPNVIAVTEGSRNRVLLLDGTSGAVVGQGGGQGRGPLEFARIGEVVPIDTDSFRVVDAGDRTLVTWSTTGQALGETQLPAEPGAPGAPGVLPRKDGGAYLVYRRVGLGGVSPSVQRDTGHVVAWDGARSETIAAFLGDEYFRTEQMMGAPAYGATGRVDGDGSGVWIGDTRTPEVTFWSEDGLARVVRWRAETVPMTPEIMNSYIDVVVAEVPAEAAGPFRQQMSAWPAIQELPVWQELVVASTGEAWVSPDVTMRLPSPLSDDLEPRRWVVFDREGRPIGAVITPARFRLYDARNDQVVGVHIDELGVESIRAYRLSR